MLLKKGKEKKEYMTYISAGVQKRVIRYFRRLDGMKPSEFERGYEREWMFLRRLGVMILEETDSLTDEELAPEVAKPEVLPGQIPLLEVKETKTPDEQDEERILAYFK